MSRRLSPPRSRGHRFFCPVISSLTVAAFLTVAVPVASRAHAESSPGPAPEWTHRIDEAIRRGRDALLPRLEPLVEDPRSDYPGGRIAFVLCALLESGLPTRTPVVAQAFDRLARLEPTRTYCVACYLLALGALLDRLEEERGGPSAPRGSAASPVREEPAGDHGRTPPAEAAIRATMEELAEWLVSARTAGRGTWTYEVAGRSARHDFSNTQFAVLGLHVAMKHGVTVPTEVFAEIIRVFSGSIQLEATATTLTYRPATRFEALLGLEEPPEERRVRVQPGGWAYRATARAAAGQPAYPAMTAAGASSVVVAVEALRRSGDRRVRRVAEQGETTLHRAYAWIEKHFESFVADGRNLHYTLYSLEKVGDLGGVSSFGRHDWYVEGARRLVETQRGNGGWGGYVDTAFALLFLTRATRSMGVSAAPALLTRGGGDGEERDGTDLVYVDRAKGFLSARELLRYMANTRDPRLADVGRSVVRNYDPRRREDLIPHLLELWEEPGRLRTFAREALRDITGESFKRSDDVRRWYGAFLEIRRLESDSTVSAPELPGRLREVESPALKARLVRLARRRELRSLAPELADELSRAARLRTPAAASYRRLVHGLLGLWLGAAIPMPADGDARGWESVSREWRRLTPRVHEPPDGQHPPAPRATDSRGGRSAGAGVVPARPDGSARGS